VVTWIGAPPAPRAVLLPIILEPQTSKLIDYLHFASLSPNFASIHLTTNPTLNQTPSQPSICLVNVEELLPAVLRLHLQGLLRPPHLRPGKLLPPPLPLSSMLLLPRHLLRLLPPRAKDLVFSDRWRRPLRKCFPYTSCICAPGSHTFFFSQAQVK
jgi:hypothetical protein